MIKKPKFPVKELIKAGPAAPQVLVGHLVATQGPDIATKVAAERAKPGFAVESYVDDLIKSHRRLARFQGAGGGAMIFAAELPAAIGGPAAVAAAAGTAILGVHRWPPAARRRRSSRRHRRPGTARADGGS